MENLKKMRDLNELAPEPAIESCYTGQRILCFDTCQLTVIWMSIMRLTNRFHVRAFSHDITAAILVFQNNETAAMLVYPENPLVVELFSHVNAFFCSNKLAYILAT